MDPENLQNIANRLNQGFSEAEAIVRRHHDMFASPDIEDELQQMADDHRESVERDEMQTEGIRELVKQAKGASIMAIIALAIGIISAICSIAGIVLSIIALSR